MQYFNRVLEDFQRMKMDIGGYLSIRNLGILGVVLVVLILCLFLLFRRIWYKNASVKITGQVSKVMHSDVVVPEPIVRESALSGQAVIEQIQQDGLPTASACDPRVREFMLRSMEEQKKYRSQV